MNPNGPPRPPWPPGPPPSRGRRGGHPGHPGRYDHQSHYGQYGQQGYYGSTAPPPSGYYSHNPGYHSRPPPPPPPGPYQGPPPTGPPPSGLTWRGSAFYWPQHVKTDAELHQMLDQAGCMKHHSCCFMCGQSVDLEHRLNWHLCRLPHVVCGKVHRKGITDCSHIVLVYAHFFTRDFFQRHVGVNMLTSEAGFEAAYGDRLRQYRLSEAGASSQPFNDPSQLASFIAQTIDEKLNEKKRSREESPEEEAKRTKVDKETCRICLRKGHWVVDCPNKGKCGKCLQPGHRRADCTQEEETPDEKSTVQDKEMKDAPTDPNAVLVAKISQLEAQLEQYESSIAVYQEQMMDKDRKLIQTTNDANYAQARATWENARFVQERGRSDELLKLIAALAGEHKFVVDEKWAGIAAPAEPQHCIPVPIPVLPGGGSEDQTKGDDGNGGGSSGGDGGGAAPGGGAKSDEIPPEEEDL